MAKEYPWYSEFDAIFWLTLTGSVLAFMSLGLRACLRSRCTTIKCCWGAWECDRDLEAHVDVETADIEMPALNREVMSTR